MMFGFRDRFEYLECSACGTLSIRQPPEDLGRYYPAQYYSFRPLKGFYHFVKCRQAGYSFGANDLLGFVIALFLGPESSVAALRHIAPAFTARILDVGSGSGAFLHYLARLGFKHLLGIDPFLPGAEVQGKGYVVRKERLADVREKFDIITLNHVFEHLDDPLVTLQEIARHLSADGVAVIRIPVADSFAWRKFGVNWVQLDCPRHLFLHTRKGLGLLARKAGLEISKVVYDSTSFQFWGSRLYQKDIALTSKSSILNNRWKLFLHLPRLFLLSRQAKRLNNVGEGDSACFYLVRREHSQIR
jgi:SAM-dependent methyltransferase